MTHNDLRALRRKLGLTQVQLAQALVVDPQTVARWEEGKRPIRPIVQLALSHLERLHGEYQKRTNNPRLSRQPLELWPNPWRFFGEPKPKSLVKIDERRMRARIRKERAEARSGR